MIAPVVEVREFRSEPVEKVLQSLAASFGRSVGPSVDRQDESKHKTNMRQIASSTLTSSCCPYNVVRSLLLLLLLLLLFLLLRVSLRSLLVSCRP